MANRLNPDVEAWLKEIAAKHTDIPTADAVDAILFDMATDQTHPGYVAIVREHFARTGVLRWYEGYLKREQVAVVSYSGDVLSVPSRYGQLVQHDPADPSQGTSHQLALWDAFSLRELDALISTLGTKRDVLSTRVAFFANLRRRWAAECPQLQTAGEACRFLGLEAIP